MGVIPVEAKAGDFVLVHVSGQGGRVIQALQSLNGDGFADYEHVALYVGEGVLVEMASGGIQLAKTGKYVNIPTRWSTGHFVLPSYVRQVIVDAAQAYVSLHVRYGWEDYAALALHHLGLGTAMLRQSMANTKRMICSQFVDQCYADADVHLFRDNRWPGYVTPGDLNQLLDNYQDNEA